MDRDEQQEIKERLERFFGEVNAIGSEFHLTLGQYHEGLEEGHWKNWLTFAMHEMNCMSSSPDTQIEEQRISGMAFDEDCEEKLRIDLDDWECVEGEDTDELFEKIEELEDEEKKEQALEKFEND
ncbi:MAG TPA: hypothetical protein VM577_07850, partial [Anaerovoracaceae bacterium]|nr:hypothetical protein [Anaerovoracaceae bacterium]